MNWIQAVLVSLTGYLIGSIHPSYLLAKYVKDIDIREHGTNNTGAKRRTKLNLYHPISKPMTSYYNQDSIVLA